MVGLGRSKWRWVQLSYGHVDREMDEESAWESERETDNEQAREMGGRLASPN